MSSLSDLGITVGTTGALPPSPAFLRNQLVTLVTASNPGYTANLPLSMIEDIVSTDVGALQLIASAAVDTINSLTPYGASPFIVTQLGNVYGVAQGVGSNTSVYVVFAGTPGFVVSQGFTVSDGAYQYIVQDGGIVGSGSPTYGVTQPLFALALVSGSWAVPASTVTTLITSVPLSVTLSVTNPQAGIPSAAAQTVPEYQAQVIQAGRAPSQGMPTYLKSLLGQIPGVQTRLISVLQATGGYEIIVGGGDPDLVAGAIFDALFDFNNVVGSTLLVTGITNANPGVVSTNLNHGYTTGQVIQMNGVLGMTTVNGVSYTATVIDQKTFSIGTDTTSFGVYTGGGVVTPNLRNVTGTVNDYPNSYPIPFVNPPQQTVAIDLTWNTTATNFVASSVISQLGVPALVAYINNLAVGLPINLFELQETFQLSVAAILAPQLLTRMVFSVSINGIGTAPTTGTGIIVGDPESYFLTTTSAITIVQG